PWADPVCLKQTRRGLLGSGLWINGADAMTCAAKRRRCVHGMSKSRRGRLHTGFAVAVSAGARRSVRMAVSAGLAAKLLAVPADRISRNVTGATGAGALGFSHGVNPPTKRLVTCRRIPME